MSLIGSTSYGFAQNTMHDFQNTVLNSIVALASTNATKIERQRKVSAHVSLRSPRRLTWVDTFRLCRCIKPLFNTARLLKMLKTERQQKSVYLAPY